MLSLHCVGELLLAPPTLLSQAFQLPRKNVTGGNWWLKTGWLVKICHGCVLISQFCSDHQTISLFCADKILIHFLLDHYCSDPGTKSKPLGLELGMRNKAREVRLQEDLSLRQLAHLVGISHTTLRRLERGEADVNASVKVRISRALGVGLAELFPQEVSDDE